MEQKNTEMPLIRMYTDGSARGNPNGPGGYGTILEYEDSGHVLHTREYSQGYIKTTNNRMEIMGVIAGFSHLNRPCTVEVYSDSQYVVNTFNLGWMENWKKDNWMHGKGRMRKSVKNQDLWKELLRLMEGHSVTFHWVRGHNGFPQNERCDELAVTAATSGDLTEDPGAPENS